jgi:hypothetical protein
MNHFLSIHPWNLESRGPKEFLGTRLKPGYALEAWVRA